MHITVAGIGGRSAKKDPFESLVSLYLGRVVGFSKTSSENFRTEDEFFQWAARMNGRTAALIALLDGRGRKMSSETFAAWLKDRREEGSQHLIFAVGPASGWSESARKQASLLLSLGDMTMAHALAKVVMAEQIYRAYTILTGHPYHSGH